MVRSLMIFVGYRLMQSLISKFQDVDDVYKAQSLAGRLSTLLSNGHLEVLNVLIDYMKIGTFNSVRTSISADLACMHRLPTEVVGLVGRAFVEGLGDPVLRYWSIFGAIKYCEKAAYEPLISIIINTDMPLLERVYALRLLSIHSGCSFNRNCPRNESLWRSDDVRSDEVLFWRNSNYSIIIPSASIEIAKIPHEAKDSFEAAIIQLDRNLSLERENDPENKTNPANFLVTTKTEHLKEISRRWNLPGNYLHFLRDFSPENITCFLKLKGKADYVRLYSPVELLNRQLIHATNTLTGEPLADWPNHYVAIADTFGDPFVLDLSKATHDDAPILTARHGLGYWKFSRYTKSFTEFLLKISVDYSDFECYRF